MEPMLQMNVRIREPAVFRRGGRGARSHRRRAGGARRLARQPRAGGPRLGALRLHRVDGPARGGHRARGVRRAPAGHPGRRHGPGRGAALPVPPPAGHRTAERTGRQGLNLMRSTLLTEATGASFGDLQAEQIERYRTAFREAGHTHAPRVSVSRSVFPIVTAQDRMLFGMRPGEDADQIGIIDGHRSTFGRTYAGEPDQLIEHLKADAAVQAADTLMLTIPSQAGVDLNLHIQQNFAEHVAPALGWKPNTEGPVLGDTA